MRVNCEVEVSYSLSHGGDAGKSTRSKAAICLGRKESRSKLVCQDKKDQIFLLLITAKNSNGTKYFVR